MQNEHSKTASNYSYTLLSKAERRPMSVISRGTVTTQTPGL